MRKIKLNLDEIPSENLVKNLKLLKSMLLIKSFFKKSLSEGVILKLSNLLETAINHELNIDEK